MNTLSTPTATQVAKENAQSYFEPRYRVDRSPLDTRVRVELPGVDKNDLNITVENKELVLDGRATNPMPESWKLLHRESCERAYRLRLRIGENVDDNAIGADLSNGVLILTFPMAEETKPRSIKIK